MSLLTSSRKTSRRAYERHAKFYDRSWIINSALGKWDDRLIALKPPTSLLDLGCGPGRLAGKLVTGGFDDVVGVDLSLSCLKITRGKIATIPLSQAYIEELPFRDGCFSSAVFSGVFHHLENPHEVFPEIYRILKRGGLLYILEPYFPPLIRQITNLVLDIYPVTGDRRFYRPNDIFRIAAKHNLIKKEAFIRLLSYILVLERC